MGSLRNRFFLQSSIPILAVCAAVVTGGLFYVNAYYEKDAISQKNNEVQNVSRAINDWLIARTSEIIQLSRAPAFQGGDVPALLEYLREWRSHLAFIYSEAFFIRPDGAYWSSSGGSGKLRDSGFLAQFEEDTPRYFSIGPVPGEPIFLSSVVAAVPIYVGPRIAGVMVGVIPFEVVNRMIGFFTFSGFSSYMLVDQSGRIIAHSDVSLPGKTEREVYGRDFSTSTRYGEKQVFVNVLKTTWKFVTFEPRAVLFAPIRRINGLIGLTFSIVILILFGVAFTTVSRIVRPIAKLIEGVERIMAGDFSQHVSIDTRDEMRTLADSFNRLCDRMIRMRTDDRFAFLGHISARMAHEMRKPLHIIQLAAHSMSSPERFNVKYTDMIIKEVENADRFLTEILHFAKPDMLNLQSYPLPALWEKILQKYRLVADDMRIELEYRQVNPIPVFYIDILKLEQAFSNLLDNAFEATDSARRADGDGHLVLVEQEHIPEKGVAVRIIDSGSGFDESAIDRLFEPYFTTKEGGTGLGLSIAYRILSAHGATIGLKNTPESHGMVEMLFPI
jgi:signal transduction histidine kinase